jgi:hypothetical protein
MTQEQDKVSKCCGSEVTINYIGDNPNYPFNRCNKCGQPCEVITQPIQKEEEVECNFPIPCYMCLHRKEAGGNCNKTKKTTEKYTPTPSDTFIEKEWEKELALLLQKITAEHDKWKYAMYLYQPIKDFLKSSLQEQKQSILEEIEKLPKVQYGVYGSGDLLRDIKQLLK